MRARDRAWFALSLTLGRLLRAGRYARTQLTGHDGELQVRKQRTFYAPLLISLGDPLMWFLGTGVRVLPQREWEDRERLLYGRLYGRPVGIERDGTLLLPPLAGETLATLLERPTLTEPERIRAMEIAAFALARFHAQGFTHGDAMAENVMVDVEAGVARWFDFETVHQNGRSIAWRRADDVRALLATCLLRTAPGKMAETLGRILDVYGDDDVTRLLAGSFTSVLHRALIFHLGQAALSFAAFREIGRLLGERQLATRTGSRVTPGLYHEVQR